MRKRDTPYRSSLALALVLCLLAGLMLACSTGETKGNSLWGKQLTAEKETVPAEAVDGKYGYCIGVARNSRLLLTDDRSIWLYDGETKEQIPLIPGDEETEAGLLQLLEISEEEAASLDGEELLNLALFGESQDRPAIVSEQRSGDWMLLKSLGRSGCSFLLDPLSGKCYARCGTMLRCVDGLGDELLFWAYMDGFAVWVLNRETGEMTQPKQLEGLGADACSFLQDGSLCVLTRTPGDRELLILTPEGGEERYDLGQIAFGSDSRSIWSVGDRSVLLFDLVKLSVPPILIDRKSGEVSMLQLEEGEMKSSPLKDRQDENGRLRMSPAERMSQSFYPGLEMADGETMLLYCTREQCLALFRPESMELQFIPNGDSLGGLRGMSYSSSNGRDWIYEQYSGQLIRLQIEEDS